MSYQNISFNLVQADIHAIKTAHDSIRKMKKLIILFLFPLLAYGPAAQATDSIQMDAGQITEAEIQIDTIKKIKDDVKELKDRLDKLTSKSVRFGLSIGYRRIKPKHIGEFQTASISTSDTTLHLESGNKGATVLSTSILITPFKTKPDEIEEEIKRLDKNLWLKKTSLRIRQVLYYAGLQANINLLDFTDAQQKFTFNKSIEGGMGICLRLSDKIYYSIHTEIFFSRQLRQYLQDQEGHKIRDVNGSIVTSIDQLDIDNDNYYLTKAVYGFVNRIIIVF